MNLKRDFKAMDIFWVTSKSELEQELDDSFRSLLNAIQATSENLAEMGQMPKLKFIKGKMATCLSISSIDMEVFRNCMSNFTWLTQFCPFLVNHMWPYFSIQGNP